MECLETVMADDTAHIVMTSDGQLWWAPRASSAKYLIEAATPMRFPRWKVLAAHIGSQQADVYEDAVMLALLRLPRYRNLHGDSLRRS